MSCEKASRRLKNVIAKANRLGLTTKEVTELPTTKRFLPGRVPSPTWTVFLALVLIIGGSVVLTLVCAPCVARGRT